MLCARMCAVPWRMQCFSTGRPILRGGVAYASMAVDGQRQASNAVPSRNMVASGARTCVIVKVRTSNERRPASSPWAVGTARHRAAVPPGLPPRSRAASPSQEWARAAQPHQTRARTYVPAGAPPPAGLAARPESDKARRARDRNAPCRPPLLTQQRTHVWGRGLRAPALHAATA